MAVAMGVCCCIPEPVLRIDYSSAPVISLYYFELVFAKKSFHFLINKSECKEAEAQAHEYQKIKYSTIFLIVLEPNIQTFLIFGPTVHFEQFIFTSACPSFNTMFE